MDNRHYKAQRKIIRRFCAKHRCWLPRTDAEQITFFAHTRREEGRIRGMLPALNRRLRRTAVAAQGQFKPCVLATAQGVQHG